MHATTISMYQSDLKEIILKAAKSYQEYLEVKEKFQQSNLLQKSEEYKLEKAEILMYMGKIYVPNSQELKNLILKKCIMCLMLGTLDIRK